MKKNIIPHQNLLLWPLMRCWLFIVVFLIGSFVSGAFGKERPCPDLNHVYQYGVKVGTRTAYLWIPPRCSYVRGVIVAFANLLERNWLEDPEIRKTAAALHLGIIWIGPAAHGDSLLTADFTPTMASVFQKMLDDFSVQSGYKEIRNAFVIPTGHSACGHFAWRFPSVLPNRTIACIPIKTWPLPDSLSFSGIPMCYMLGETTEWPQFRVPDLIDHPGDRNFYWPEVTRQALALRKKDPATLLSVIIEPGGGHFDWSRRLSAYFSLFIRKACWYRLPQDRSKKELRPIDYKTGYLSGAEGLRKDPYLPSTYRSYRGQKDCSYWFFDKQTAYKAYMFEGDRKVRKTQMTSFFQDGKLLPVANIGYAPIRFEPMNDGMTFRLKGGFLSTVPPELIGAGRKLSHAPGRIKLSVITGGAVQLDQTTFKLKFDRWGIGGDIWLLSAHAGNRFFRHAVQPGKLSVPTQLKEGLRQTITFIAPHFVNKKTHTLKLKASATSGLPVSFYVDYGPAYVKGSSLVLTEIPMKSAFPIKVRVVAYQWGRILPVQYQSAPVVIKDIYIK